MDPLAERILVLIRSAHLSSNDRRAIKAALRDVHVDHRNTTAKWFDAQEFLVDLCDWVASLPDDELPPREQDAARHFGCTTRTIKRWLGKVGMQMWEDFLRFYMLAKRDN